MEHTMNQSMYKNLTVMIVISYISMFVLMYAMVNSFANVFININQFYMAGLMTTPMIIIELFVMKMMYKDKKLNSLIIGASVIFLALFWFAIRYQVGVDDKQFVRSMIPHHGGAVLMCEEANLQDPELKQFCQNIIKGQNGEIEQMKAILERLNR